MKTQDMHDDVLGHHGVAGQRLQLAERRLRELGMPDERLDACSPREHGLQVWKFGECAEVGMHESEVVDLFDVAGLGPDADFQIGQMLLEGVAPGGCGADVLVEIDDEQRHRVSSGHSWAARRQQSQPATAQTTPLTL